MKMPQLTLMELGKLPSSMRVLSVSDAGQTLEETLSTASGTRVDLISASLANAMQLLREAMFDVVVLHDTEHLDAVHVMGPVRTAAPDCLAVVVISDSDKPERHVQCLEAGADDFVERDETDATTLIWKLARAAERQLLVREYRSSEQQKARKQSEDQQDAIRQLRTQRSLLLEHLQETTEQETNPNPPEWLIEYFGELLRVYVVSGFGNHQDEVRQLLDRLDCCEVTLAEALMAHSIAVEQLVQSRRGRSAKHILGRANLVALELLMQREARVPQEALLPQSGSGGS